MRVDEFDDPADVVLRSIFEREARRVPMTGNAHAALTAMQPALRRAAMRRALVTAAVVALGAGGVAGLVNAVRMPPGAATIDVRPTPTETLPPVIEIQPVRPDGGPVDAPTTTASAPGDAVDSMHPSPIVVDAAEPVVPTTSVDTASPSTTAHSTNAATPAPVVPAPTPSPAVPPPAETTTPTSAPATPVLSEYPTDCGTVIADLSVDPPIIVDVVGADGYRIVIEEADHAPVVVHLVGRRTTCEVHVGAEHGDHVEHDGDEHDERSSAEQRDDD